MKLLLLAGTTSQRARVFLQDSTSTTGAGLTGLTFASSGLTWSYIREDQSTATAVTVVTATVGTWTSGGFKEISSSLLPGVYEVGVPNAALASGKSVQMLIFGATNLAPCPVEIELTAVDHQSAAFGLSLAKTTNITGFNDIAATAVVSGGAITTAAGKVSGVTLVDTLTTYTGNTVQTGDAFARVGAAGAGLTALGDARLADLDAAVSSRLATAGYTTPPTVGQIGAQIMQTPGYMNGAIAGGVVADSLPYAINAINQATTLTSSRLGTPVNGNFALDISAIQAKTVNLPAAPADESLVIAATNAIYSRIGAPTGASIAADIQTRSTFAGGAVASVSAPVTVTGTVSATLVSTGLDAVAATVPTHGTLGSWTFPQKLMWLAQRFLGKAARTPTALTVYAADGTTAVTSQAVSDDGSGTESQGAAT